MTIRQRREQFYKHSDEFAEIVEAHNITFIGPKTEHIKCMGDKIEAKITAQKLGIPLVPIIAIFISSEG